MTPLLPRRLRALFCCTLVLGTAVAAQAQPSSALENAFPNLSFNDPTELTFADDGSNRLYIGEKNGLIRVFENSRTTTTISTFLDISALSQNGGERGFLGFAFHPDYATNGYVYLHYSGNDGRTVLARYTRSAFNPLVANPSSALILLEVAQPYSNHNGGKLAFGPDGYLYLSLGDGGSGGDPENRAQNRAVLLGKLLRLDVDNPASPLNYGIPPDNPFVGNTAGYREEIFAYGLRNMWKFGFDRADGTLWGADVGQNQWEEVNLIENGGNYGWKPVEGPACYVAGCNLALYDAPIYWYNHDLGCSVTGGTVYRGVRNPELTGTYVYADYCAGTVWGLTYENGTAANRTLVEAGFGVIAFGEDQAGELYVLEQSAGTEAVRRFVPTAPSLTVERTRPTSPVVVPAGGGSILIKHKIRNVGSASASFETWLTLRRPNGSTVNAGGPDALTLAAGAVVKRVKTLTLAASAAPGTYVFTRNVGTFPGVVVASESYTFTKSATAPFAGDVAGTWAEAAAVLEEGEVDEGTLLVASDGAAADAAAGVLPARTTLRAPFPNPTIGRTMIPFDVADALRVEVAVFDVLGRRVVVLHDGPLSSGTHTLAFDTATLPAGVYVVRAEGDGVAVTRRVVVAR